MLVSPSTTIAFDALGPKKLILGIGRPMPLIQKDDIVAFGAYFALNPVLKDKVRPFLNYAKEQGAILYYDLNFRDNHAHEVEALRDTFKENFAIADIVRGSHEDFINGSRCGVRGA